MSASARVCRSCQRGDCLDCSRLMWREPDACCHDCAGAKDPVLFTLSELSEHQDHGRDGGSPAG